MIGKAIFAQLSGDSSVSAVVSDRIYQQLGPNPDPIRDFPSIVYEVTDNPQEEGRTLGARSTEEYTVNVLCIATSDTQLEILVSAVKAALNEQSGTWGGIIVQGMFLESASSGTFTVQGAEAFFTMREMVFSSTVTI